MAFDRRNAAPAPLVPGKADALRLAQVEFRFASNEGVLDWESPDRCFGRVGVTLCAVFARMVLVAIVSPMATTLLT